MSFDSLLQENNIARKLLAYSELFTHFYKFANPLAKILPSSIVDKQLSLTAIGDIPSGSLIFSYTNYIIHTRTRTSIQVGPNMHIEAGEFGKYANHSCNPNGIIETRMEEGDSKASVLLITIRDIAAKEEITFDYSTTENILTRKASELNCLCGSKNCRGKIYGFDTIPESEKQYLLSNELVANHLLKY